VLDEVITALFRSVAFGSAVQFSESLFAAIKDNQIKLERITEARFKGSLVIPVKSISMINQVNKEYPWMPVILVLSGYYGFFQFY